MLHKNYDKKLFNISKIGHFNNKILTYNLFGVIFDLAVDITFHERAEMRLK